MCLCVWSGMCLFACVCVCIEGKFENLAKEINLQV